MESDEENRREETGEYGNEGGPRGGLRGKLCCGKARDKEYLLHFATSFCHVPFIDMD